MHAIIHAGIRFESQKFDEHLQNLRYLISLPGVDVNKPSTVMRNVPGMTTLEALVATVGDPALDIIKMLLKPKDAGMMLHNAAEKGDILVLREAVLMGAQPACDIDIEAREAIRARKYFKIVQPVYVLRSFAFQKAIVNGHIGIAKVLYDNFFLHQSDYCLKKRFFTYPY